MNRHSRLFLRSAPFTRCALLVALAGLTGPLAIVVRPASAHLSLIREGLESAGLHTSDHFGSAVALGDFNGDGHSDLATGAPDRSFDTNIRAGVVIINWGCPTGLTHVGSILLSEESLGGDPGLDHVFGSALAVADFDENGYDDLVIGAPGGGIDPGHVYVVWGAASGFGAGVLALDGSLGGPEREDGDRFGEALAIGQFSNPYLGLVIGAPGKDNNSGAIYLGYFGDDSGLSTQAAMIVRRSQLGGSDTPNERFGGSLATGALIYAANWPDPDLDDIVVGETTREHGGVWVITSTGIKGFMLDSAVHHDATEFGPAQEGNLKFGWSLAVLDGDTSGSNLGIGELAIGEPSCVTLGPGHGRVILVDGAFNDLDVAGATVLTEVEAICQSQGNASPLFGYSLAYSSTGNLWIGAPDFTGPGSKCYVSVNDSSACTRYDRKRLDNLEPDADGFGSSIALGGYARHVVGSRAETSEVLPLAECGAVHVIDPPHQPQGLSWRRSVVLDCANQIVYSKRPFEPTSIAGCALAMTLLVAAEHIQLSPADPDYRDPTALYEVAAFVANNVGGAQFGLQEGEHLSLIDLLYGGSFTGGNDAAYAIADVVGSGATLFERLASFVGEMNAKAAALGLTGTHFSTPAGFADVADGQWSTPYDMALLSRAVLGNGITRTMANGVERTMSREVIVNGVPVALAQITVKNGFAGLEIADVSGVRHGHNGGKVHGLFALRSGPEPEVIATSFETASPGRALVGDAVELLALPSVGCPAVLPAWQSALPKLIAANLSVSAGSITGTIGAVKPPEPEVGPPEAEFPWTIDVYRQDGSGPVDAGFECAHRAEAGIDPGRNAVVGLAPFSGHGDIHILNMDPTTQRLRVSLSYLPDPTDYMLGPGEELVIPGFESPSPLPSFTLDIGNLATSGSPVHLAVEVMYEYSLIGVGEPNIVPAFSAQLMRRGNLSNETLEMVCVGDGSVLQSSAAPSETSHLLMVAHPSGTIVGVALPLAGVPAAPAHLAQNYPNPFNPETTIRFSTQSATRARMAVFDSHGRLVKTLLNETVPAGDHRVRWSGKSESGTPVASGVYFYQLTTDSGFRATHKMVLAK